MYDLALSVTACLRAGTRVDVAWLVDGGGVDRRRLGEALVVTPGGGRIGTVLGGALDEQLVSAAGDHGRGRLLELPAGGSAVRCAVMPATDLPEQLWPHLLAREPVCLVTELDGNWTGATEVFTPDTIANAGPDVAAVFSRRATLTAVLAGSLVTALWPVPRLITVGGGPVLDALAEIAAVLGWSVADFGADVSGLEVLTGLDAVVVAAHDVDLAGAALAGALAGEAGYIGVLGSRAMQQARADWLSDRGVVDLARIHGPAGLDIGARTPAEIAVAIVAELLSLRPS